MSVFPYIDMGNVGGYSKDYRFVLINNGIGPAIIKSVTVKYDDRKVYEDVIDYVSDQITSQDSVNYYYANIPVGRLIPAEEVIDIIGLNDGKLTSSERLFNILNDEKLLIEIEYESIYGESWVISNKTGVPEKK